MFAADATLETLEAVVRTRLCHAESAQRGRGGGTAKESGGRVRGTPTADASFDADAGELKSVNGGVEMAKRKRASVPPGGALFIPPLPTDLVEPVRALVRCSVFLEAFVVAMAEGKSFRELAVDRLDALEAASRAIEAWRTHLGIEVGGGDAASGELNHE